MKQSRAAKAGSQARRGTVRGGSSTTRTTKSQTMKAHESGGGVTRCVRWQPRPIAAVHGTKSSPARSPIPEGLRPQSASDGSPRGPKRAPRAPLNPSRCRRNWRRLAKKPPEFGMVQERRGPPPLYGRYPQLPPAGSERCQRPAKGTSSRLLRGPGRCGQIARYW